jgi:hypothetical protein
MRTTALVLLAVSLPLLASANPVPLHDIYISFDPAGSRMYETTPDPGTSIRAFVVVDQTDQGSNGLTTVSFKLSNPVEDFPGCFSSADFVNLLPGDLSIGDWDEGITIASTMCMSWPVVVGYLECSYVGGPASICIEDHPDYPHWVSDCSDPAQFYMYEVPVNGMISGGDGNCHPGSPVESVTWGAVKALYR